MSVFSIHVGERATLAEPHRIILQYEQRMLVAIYEKSTNIVLFIINFDYWIGRLASKICKYSNKIKQLGR